MAALGSFAVLLTLAAAAWGLGAAVLAGRTGRVELARSAEGGLLAAACAATVAALTLFWLLLRHDFTVAYVADHSSRSMPTFYTLAAFWAGQEGSLLLWAWLLALCGAVMVWQGRRHYPQLLPVAVAVVSGGVLLFATIVVVTADPFARTPVAVADGQGLNLLLRNYAQWVHPLTLYLGFVGLTVPFALAMAALVTGAPDQQWQRPARRWMLWSWLFLTAGIVLGMRWAYVELGWGGYWAWDPVENASLLPWLTATAFLHTAGRPGGTFRITNHALVATTFTLSLLGTFLTRSGVVSSVHAFGESGVGPFLLGGIVATVVLAGALIVWRMPALRGGARLESLASGAGAALLGTILLVWIMLVVLWGTIYPLTSRALGGAEGSVAASYYGSQVAPAALALLLLTGVGPLLAHRAGDRRRMARELGWAGAAGVASFAALVAWSGGRQLAGLTVVAVAVFVTVALMVPVLRDQPPWHRPRGVRWRYGALLVHAGVALLVAGVAVHTSFRSEARATLAVGERTQLAGYQLRLTQLRTVGTADGQATVAELAVSSAADGRPLGTVTTEQITAGAGGQPVAEVGIRATLAEDLYLVLERADVAGGTATIGVFVNPGVLLIWLGGAAAVAGALVAAIPGRRRAPPPAAVAGAPPMAATTTGGTR